MSDITRVALDAMGGDHAPAEMVKGAIEAVNKRDDIKDSAYRAGSTAEKGVIRIYLSQRPD